MKLDIARPNWEEAASVSPAHGVCSRGHKTLLRCPGCMRRQFVAIEPLRIECASCVRAWRLEDGVLVEDAEQAQRPAAVTPEAEKLVREAHASGESDEQPLEVIESAAQEPVGYREAFAAYSLELVRPPRQRRVSRQRSAPVVPVMVGSGVVVSVTMAATVMASLFGGSEAALGTFFGVFFVGALVFNLILQKRFIEEVVSIGERRVRIASDRIEAKAGERWVPIAQVDRVTEIVAHSDADRSRVYVRLEGGEPQLVLDELQREEAEEVRTRVEALIRRAQA